jgi:hypothetical protein
MILPQIQTRRGLLHPDHQVLVVGGCAAAAGCTLLPV